MPNPANRILYRKSEVISPGNRKSSQSELRVRGNPEETSGELIMKRGKRAARTSSKG